MSRSRPLRSNAAVLPFWHRLGAIASYPLRDDALLTLLVLTVSGLLAWVPGIGWLLSVVVYFSGYKYAFEVLLATANGRADAPTFAMLAQNGAVWRLLGLLLALLLFLKLAVLADAGWMVVPAIAVAAFFQPGILISLATGGGLTEALNPANAFRMIRRIGATYFVVAFALFVIQAMVLLAARSLAAVVPGFVAALVVDAAFYWSLFASFHLLGYVMYQFHGELGYTPSRHVDALPTPHDRDLALLDSAAVRADEGDPDGAIELLRDEVRTRSVTPAVHERYRQLLRQAGDAAALDAHAVLFLGMLVQDKRERRALGLLREALDANPAFAPDPAHGEWLARRASELGQFHLAADAWRSLLRADPRHPAAPQWALQAAQVLHERFGESAAARATLVSAHKACRDETAIAALDAAIRALPADGLP